MSGGARALRVGLTGADGMLGRGIREAAARRGVDITCWDLPGFDLTDAEVMMRAVAAARPDVVIHAGAMTDVDGCESEPELAMRVNGEGTRILARACAQSGSRLLMVSTDYVFAGDQGRPYREDDRPGPVSAYGRSKLAAEEAVLELGDGGTVARTAWLYAHYGRNFLLTMLRLGRERGAVRVVDDQTGSPTYAADLADALLELAARGGPGVYHVTNAGSVTWHGFAKRIFELAGLPVEVTPVTTGEFPRPAPRPANSVLANTRFAEEGLPAMPSWDEALQRCLGRVDTRTHE